MELTTVQKLVYELYCKHIEEHGVAPTVLFMASELEMERSSVYDTLHRLEAKGYLKKRPITIKRLMPVKRKP